MAPDDGNTCPKLQPKAALPYGVMVSRDLSGAVHSAHTVATQLTFQLEGDRRLREILEVKTIVFDISGRVALVGVKANAPPLFFKCLTYMSRLHLSRIPNQGATLPFWVSIRQLYSTDNSSRIGCLELGTMKQGHSALSQICPGTAGPLNVEMMSQYMCYVLRLYSGGWRSAGVIITQRCFRCTRRDDLRTYVASHTVGLI